MVIWIAADLLKVKLQVQVLGLSTIILKGSPKEGGLVCCLTFILKLTEDKETRLKKKTI